MESIGDDEILTLCRTQCAWNGHLCSQTTKVPWQLQVILFICHMGHSLSTRSLTGRDKYGERLFLESRVQQ